MDPSANVELKGLAVLVVLIVVGAFLSGCTPANIENVSEEVALVEQSQIPLSVSNVSQGGLLLKWQPLQDIERYRLYKLEYQTAHHKLIKETTVTEVLDVVGCSKLEYYKLFGVKAGQLVELSDWAEGRTPACSVR